jgi:hypothetical protein
VTAAPRVAIVSRVPDERLASVFAALRDVGVDARHVIYSDLAAAQVRDELLRVDGALVWVDPIGKSGEDRRGLDAILREVSTSGVLVSAHPDVVALMGTKEVLVETRELAWGTDVERYRTPAALRAGLAARLPIGARVIKPRYGNGGSNVWKVEAAGAGTVRVHGAERRDTDEEVIALDELLDRCAPEFAAGGCFVDQPFQPRVAEGLVRCYHVADEVVGFAHQSAAGLLTGPDAAARVMGLPSPKTMYPADHEAFARLRSLARDCVPAMCDVLGLSIDELPMLWDADFLLTEDDTYVLCEINCSCVTPFPPGAPARIADAVRKRLA